MWTSFRDKFSINKSFIIRNVCVFPALWFRGLQFSAKNRGRPLWKAPYMIINTKILCGLLKLDDDVYGQPLIWLSIVQSNAINVSTLTGGGVLYKKNQEVYVLLFGIGEKFSCNKFFIKKDLYVRVSSREKNRCACNYCYLVRW